jgi:hypothetical protein
MIASEVPVILEKACQSTIISSVNKLSPLNPLSTVFISELTARAYIDSTKRRTLTKIDIAKAIKQSDLFDFLIDVVPGETEKKEKSLKGGAGGGSVSSKSRRHSHEEEDQKPSEAQLEEPIQGAPNTINNGIHRQEQQQYIPQQPSPEAEEDEAAINDHLLNFDEANDVTLPADFSEGIFGLNAWDTQDQ